MCLHGRWGGKKEKRGSGLSLFSDVRQIGIFLIALYIGIRIIFINYSNFVKSSGSFTPKSSKAFLASFNLKLESDGANVGFKNLL